MKNNEGRLISVKEASIYLEFQKHHYEIEYRSSKLQMNMDWFDGKEDYSSININ